MGNLEVLLLFLCPIFSQVAFNFEIHAPQPIVASHRRFTIGSLSLSRAVRKRSHATSNKSHEHATTARVG